MGRSSGIRGVGRDAIGGAVDGVSERVKEVPGQVVALPVVALGGALAGLSLVRRYANVLERQGVAEAARAVAGDALATSRSLATRAGGVAAGTLRKVGVAVPLGGRVEPPSSYFSDEAVAVGAPGTATEIAERVAEEVERQQADDLPPMARAESVGASTPAASPELAAELAAEVRGEIETVEPTAPSAPTPSSAPEKAPLGHGELPLPDYDHMTLGSLRGRLRTLSVADLVTLRAYERAHANRIQIVTMLENRIAKLEREASAGGGQQGTSTA